MKFRGRMVDTVAMRDFTNIANVLAKMSKFCVLRLTPREVCFNVEVDHVPVVWVQILQNHFFREYAMMGASEEHNEIYLELDTVMLSRSTNSLKSAAKSVKIKLTNKQQPCLTFEIELPSLSAESRQCVHDVPIRVIPRKEWTEYQAPNIPEVDISLDMPQLSYVRKVVERMKNMSNHLIVTADRTGHFILKIETSSASVATQFQGLQVWKSNSETEEEKFSAMVDIKRFLMFLAWDVIHPENVKCNILGDRMVNLNLNLDTYLTIQYFLPAISL